ncbi:MAG TPA: peptidase M28 [Planctomycetaceae bacterium]|nr:peptidase M28 [Blastopirellula sp.]HAY80577.1 peptidase M28 [Planctomycetaceae bacterium]
MPATNLQLDTADVGQSICELAARLFPLHRSLTGEGNRETLHCLAESLPLEVHAVATGESVLDWRVPQEWRIRDAFIADAAGNRIVDYRQSNLHVVNGSVGVQATLPWSELRSHLHSLPKQPDAIPYRTDFFQSGWGFCLPHRLVEQLENAPQATYQVCIDAEYFDGELNYGEIALPGSCPEQVVLYAHLCHPSLANDNLAGICLAAHLAQWLRSTPRRYSYRIVFAPATLGAITWLARNEQAVSQIRHGLVLTLLGCQSPFTYKRSRRMHAAIDRIVARCLAAYPDSEIRPFTPIGYDERQFCSPGFNLPFGCLMRSGPGEFPEYHTSHDNLATLKSEVLAESFALCKQVLEAIEAERIYVRKDAKGEPCLGRYGIYRALGERDDRGRFQEAMMWLLNLADGEHSLVDMAEQSQLPLSLFEDVAETLTAHGLVESRHELQRR